MVSPSSASLQPNQTQQFTAKVTGSTNQGVTWLINGVRGGAPSIGVITGGGLYTAPADPATALNITVEAEPAALPEETGAATVGVAAATQTGLSYYVATTGNDSNPGTAQEPWRTIQHAVDEVTAGGEIFVATGVYNELVTIAHSGSATAGFISLEAGSGQAPIIDGTGLKVPTGQYGLVTINNASFIRLVGFELRNYRSSSAALVPIGVYVEGAGSHIEILSNHIHNIVTAVTTSAGDALGIAVYGTKASAPISWLTIKGNELDDLTTGFSESLSLSGNVEYFEITDNLIHDNDNIGVNVEGFFHTAPDGYDQARDGLVAGNTVYNITSVHNPAYGDTPGADGIYVDGGEFVTVQQNLVHNADIGIEMASENLGKATNQVLTHDNVVYHSLVTGISIGGASATKNGGTTNCVIANNTLFDNDTSQSGSGEFQIQFHAEHNLFYNNILDANAQGLLVNAFAPGTTAPATLNHNLYYSSAGAGSQWIWLGRAYTGFSRYQAKTNEDRGSLFANPQFVNAGSFNFELASTSPAISLGQNLGLADIGLMDEAGNPRTMASTVDAGAYEH